MSRFCTVFLALSLLGLSACASSVRIGGGGDEDERQWDYEVLHASQIAKMNPAEIAAMERAGLADSEWFETYNDSLERGLDELGAQGWELVGIQAQTYVFRQPRKAEED